MASELKNDEVDNEINVETKKDEPYEFSKNNHFIDDHKATLKIIKNLKHSLHGLSYDQCIKYSICGYFAMHFDDDQAIAMDIENLCVEYLGFESFLYEIGCDLMTKQGDMTNAILCFEAYLNNGNKSKLKYQSVAFRHLGRCHAHNDHHDYNAIPAYLECYRLNEYDLDCLIELGLAYNNQSNEDEALRYLKEFIVKHTDYAELSELKQGKKSNHEYVTFLFKKALEINEDDIDILIVLGILYALSSEYEISAKHLRHATEIKSDDASLWNKLGAVLGNGGKPREAIAAQKKALELRPNYTRVSVNLGMNYRSVGENKKACNAYLFGLKLNPNEVQIWDYLRPCLKPNLKSLCDQRDVELFRPHYDF